MLLFRKDLRTFDNIALLKACEISDQLLCIYCYDNDNNNCEKYKPAKISKKREAFIFKSLQDLDNKLQKMGQKLLVFKTSPLEALNHLNANVPISTFITSQDPGWYEKKQVAEIKSSYKELEFLQFHNNTLFDESEMPLDLINFPSSFSKFRKTVEDQEIKHPWAAPERLPPMPDLNTDKFSLNFEPVDSELEFVGGESAGEQRLLHYFETNSASTYKETRNALDGKNYSTKFSIWLSNGCISARNIISNLKKYESLNGKNNSTYWIFFELLWREYFQWYAHHYKESLYKISGVTGIRPLSSFYAERLKKWEQGTTPYPLVNALMNQLVSTGYMSNRGRQIVASCLVNELELDWRYGASFMESHLIDYDVASNWGNWQSIAGVSSDGKKKHFDINKQTKLFDPHRSFIKHWKGERGARQLDSVDQSDWPI
mgnify:FL=1